MRTARVALVLDVPAHPHAGVDEPGRPAGPLTHAERREAVRAALLAMLDLHAPQPLDTTTLLASLPAGDVTRGRGQLRRLTDVGLVSCLRGEGRLWWASAVLPVTCHACPRVAARVAYVLLDRWWGVFQPVCERHQP